MSIFAERQRHHAPSNRAAVAYLVRHGYVQVKDCWMRGQKEVALVVPLVTGKFLVKEGIGA
ncbi:hypothetical protein ACEUCJ_14930 [Aeromonas rivipollensis]|uniref:hypothetical protein n=1 Tax=Aeromonas rivipollensis TaxID=948519 RepID=UPI0038CFE2C1